MYILINKCGDDFSVLAASENKDILRNKLQKRATRYIKEYYLGKDGVYCDEKSQELGKKLLQSLNDRVDKDYWDDGDEECIMSWKIITVPVFKKPRKPKIVKMAFGFEMVKGLEDCGCADDVRKLVKEYKDSSNLVVRHFNTEAEKKAYLLGVNDNYGWEYFTNIKFEYPDWAKLIPNNEND